MRTSVILDGNDVRKLLRVLYCGKKTLDARWPKHMESGRPLCATVVFPTQARARFIRLIRKGR